MSQTKSRTRLIVTCAVLSVFIPMVTTWLTSPSEEHPTLEHELVALTEDVEELKKRCNQFAAMTRFEQPLSKHLLMKTCKKLPPLAATHGKLTMEVIIGGRVGLYKNSSGEEVYQSELSCCWQPLQTEWEPWPPSR